MGGTVFARRSEGAQFVKRARNRLSKANQALVKAQDERARLEQELRDDERFEWRLPSRSAHHRPLVEETKSRICRSW